VTHWAPWTSYIGLGVGIGAAALTIVRTARKFSARIEAEDRAAAQGQSHEDAGSAAPADRDGAA
ncbi:MAG TPA: hypothetical protein VIK91_21115, partial [Nannocystis sp.]